MRLLSLACVAALLTTIVAGPAEAQLQFQRNGSKFANQLKSRLHDRGSRGSKPQGQTGSQPSKIAQAGDKRGSKQEAKLVGNPNDGQFQQRPDLMITSLTHQGNRIQVFVANVGKVRSPETTVETSIFRIGGDLLKKHVTRLGPMVVGKSIRIQIHTKSLNNVVVISTVDPQKRVTEVRENNNASHFTVGNQLENAADLAITDIQFVRNSREVWVTVYNHGRSTVTQRVPLSLVSHSRLGTDQRQLHIISNLKPGLFRIFRFKPDNFDTGMRFEAKADPNNDLPELSEANNRRIVTLR